MDMTMLLVFGLVFAAAELALGTLIGWWLRGKRDTTQAAAQTQSADEQTSRAKKALDNLNRLAASVAANVGEHNSQVQAINTELAGANSANGAPSESVVMASVAKLMEANDRLQKELKSAENKLYVQAGELQAREADALTDALTGRANRRAFDNEIERRIVEWNRRQTPVTLLMVDVDHFKKFNDTHGHQAGDEVLRGVAQTLFKSMRDMDLVARYGGEEFAVVMPVTTVEQSKTAVERARAAIEQAVYSFEGKNLKVTISGGVAQTQSSDVPATLIKRADDALYAAKKAGRNRAYLHDGQQALPLLQEPVAQKPAEPAKIEKPAPVKKPEPMKAPIVVPSAAKPAATAKKAETPLVHADKIPAGDTDPQTGVSSRAVFNLDLRRRLAEAKRYNSPLSTMIVSIDKFAEHQATYGEQMTHLVLRTVAQFLAAAIREMDTVARFGEDSFAILLPGTQLSSAASIAERLRQSISLHALKSPTGDLQLTVSVGVAEVETNDESDTISQRAAEAANVAIGEGGNRTTLSRRGECIGLDAVLVG